MQHKTLKLALRFVGVPFLTFLLFMFKCSDPAQFVYYLIGCFLLSIVLWEGTRYLNDFYDRHLPWDHHPVSRIFSQFVSVLLLTAVVNYFFTNWCSNLFTSWQFDRETYAYYFFISIIISILYSSLFSGEYFYKKWKTSLVMAEELKRQNLQTQYEALKSQVNPHFLFNSINTIAGLIEEDKKLAIQYCEQFGKTFRYILEHRNDELVPLSDELAIFDKQVFLLKGRFRNNLHIKIHISPADMEKYIPPLTLQMLLENAIKHNEISKEKPLRVEVSSNGGEMLIFKNNLQRKSSLKNSTRIGLDNLRKRYLVFAEREVQITQQNGDFIVTIPLLEKNEHESTHR